MANKEILEHLNIAKICACKKTPKVMCLNIKEEHYEPSNTWFPPYKIAWYVLSWFMDYNYFGYSTPQNFHFYPKMEKEIIFH